MNRLAVVSLVLVCTIVVISPVRADEIVVKNFDELIAAVAGVLPGDVITLAQGNYDAYWAVACETAGAPEAPITVRAETLGDAKLLVTSQSGFWVRAPHWRFENLDIQGTCADDSACEHAFHITGEADDTIVRGCRLHDFNAQVKGNGEYSGDGQEKVWPDDVVIEYNELFNSAVRNTGNPVTPIDVVGGQRWVVRGNFIHDHAKGQSDQVSYAAFFKGNSKDGLFERNLVMCEPLHSGQIRLGLSFGGGGTWPDQVCEEFDCSVEHTGGIMRNNIIVNCPADVGMYLNEAKDCGVYNNTLYNTTGIDVRFPASNATVRNNLLDGDIRARDGATVTMGSNLYWVPQDDFAAWFAAPWAADFSLLDGSEIIDLGAFVDDVTDDYCANLREDGGIDIGALEYDGEPTCNTSEPFQPTPDDPLVDADAVEAVEETAAEIVEQPTWEVVEQAQAEVVEHSVAELVELAPDVVQTPVEAPLEAAPDLLEQETGWEVLGSPYEIATYDVGSSKPEVDAAPGGNTHLSLPLCEQCHVETVAKGCAVSPSGASAVPLTLFAFLIAAFAVARIFSWTNSRS